MNKLNKFQKEVIETNNCPIIVKAGPGTGKTYTLVAKVIYLIEKKKINPKNILILTFTQKAAKEIKNRVQKQVDIKTKQIFIGTFHSLAYKLLSNYFKNIYIITSEQKIKIIKKCQDNKNIDTYFKKLNIREIALKISKFKNSLLNKKNNFQIENNFFHFLDLYNKKLKQKKLLDFDDLLLKTYNLLKNNIKIQKLYRNRFRYILIDEFQDTSPIQYEIVKLIINKNENIFVIGDPLQSIYSFRGATPNIFKLFKKEFNNTKEINLNINYRNPQEIINTALRIFPDSPEIKSFNPQKGKIKLIKTLNEYSEADLIIKKISEKVGGLGMIDASNNWTKEDEKSKFSDFAIIYRLHFLNKILVKKFDDSGIPYQMLGKESIYQKPEILLIINIIQYLKTNEKSFFEKIHNSKFIKSSEILLGKNLNELKATVKKLKLSKLIDQIIEKFNLINQNKNSKNLNKFKSVTLHFDNQKNSKVKFLKFYQKIKEKDFYDSKTDKVTLSTIHSAKGLEFKYVFLCAFEKDFFPFLREKTDLEEEKRLFYMSLTRSKSEIYLTHSEKRFGKTKEVSEFKKLILGKHLELIEDNIIEKTKKNMRRKKEKKSQMKLF